MGKKIKLKLGNSDFKSIIEEKAYFVDKSLLIEEVIDSGNDVLLLPRPRRFGKTLNLSMLRYFFEKGEPENAKLFESLKIWKCSKDIVSKQGMFPVIYLSFKDAKAESWENCYHQIVAELVKLYKENRFLLNGDTLFEEEQNKFNKILNEAAKSTDYQNSIIDLCEYLYRFHKQKVVILVDEYDTPIQSAYDKYYDEAINFMRNLLSGAFKDNKYLYKGVITGILRVSRESIFTGLNNIGVYSVLDAEFADKFGFTETEVKQVAKDFDLKTDYAKIKKWYNGYRFGNVSGIYNPWSILNFASSKDEVFKTFWTNSSANELIKTEIRNKDAGHTRNDVLKLINGETITHDIEENFVFTELESRKNLLWTLLVHSGYLSIHEKLGVFKYSLRIPNYELKTIFQKTVFEWFETDLKLVKSLLENTTDALVNNNLKEFERGFKKIIGDTFSYYDTSTNHEYVYQSYILGLLAVIGDDYIVKSNRESGEGRYDIMLIPHDSNQNGIVIEIKRVQNLDDKQDKITLINEAIKKALEQIEQNKYYKELIDNKIKIENIIKVAIVFVGKEPYVNLIG